MCVYCQGTEWTYDSSELSIEVCESGKLAVYILSGDCYVDINYCPHCGRKLKYDK